MKEKLAICLVVAMLLSMTACVGEGGSLFGGTGENPGVMNEHSVGLEYTLVDDYTYCVTGIGTCTDTDIVIPARHEGTEVTRIAAEAFRDLAGLTSISIPDSVNWIGMDAFTGCTKLIQVDNGVSYVDKWIIACDAGTTSIDLRNDTVGIAVRAFYGCDKLTSITIPDSVANIGACALEGCDSLENISMPFVVEYFAFLFDGYSSNPGQKVPDSLKSVAITSATTLGRKAFDGCAGLTSISIPDGVTSIESGAFSGCPNVVQEENGVSYVDKWVISCDTSVTTVDLRSDTVGIANSAFSRCYQLNEITIPDSIASIGAYAFYDCTGLTNIIIPNSIANVGSDAFLCCTNLSYNEFDNAFYLGNSTNPYVVLIKAKSEDIISCQIPEGVKAIYDGAFYACSQLTSIVIPDSVTSMAHSALNGCTDLTNVTLGDGVTSIGENAFRDYTNLISVSIGSGVTSIGKHAFYGCTSLTDVSFADGSQLKAIGSGAFYGCTGLTKISVPGSITSMGANAFRSCTGLTDVVIEDGASYVNDGMFCGCTSLSSITIPDSVTYIGDYVFSGCTSLTSVTLPNGITSIGEETFDGCSSLKSIAIPNSVTSIGNEAFQDCTGLTSITIPAGVTIINSEAFDGCSGLTAITIPNGVTSIGYSAFGGCSGLTAITIPDSVTEISLRAFPHTAYQEEDGVFYVDKWAVDCNEDIVNLVLRDDTVGIARGAVISCESLVSVFIPAKVRAISSYIFVYCQNLNSIEVDKKNTAYYSTGNCIIETATKTLIRGCNYSTIPQDGSITSIASNAFEDCKELTSVTVPDGVTSIGSRAFYGCYNIRKVVIPDSVTSIGGDAFYFSAWAPGARVEVHYSGTRESWRSLTKDVDWVVDYNTSCYRVYCIDD